MIKTNGIFSYLQKKFNKLSKNLYTYNITPFLSVFHCIRLEAKKKTIKNFHCRHKVYDLVFFLIEEIYEQVIFDTSIKYFINISEVTFNTYESFSLEYNPIIRQKI